MTAQNVVVVGIGAMGGGMARALLAASSTRCVTGYDKSVDAVKTFFGESQAAKKAPSSMPSTMASAITESTDFVVLSLVNQGQCEQVCFGEGENLLNLVPKGSCVVMTSTVTATWATSANERFKSAGILFVDCPVSGGPARALTGELTIMASGDAESLTKARPVLDALGKEVHIIEGGAGFGSTVKCVHQLLAGVHICAAAEAMAMAAKAGLDVEQLYRIVNGAAGASWMFTDRGQRMLSAEADVKSALDIFVKDLDIVYSESKTMQCPIPLASVALQQFISGQCLGLGKSDDSQVVKVYERITGVSIASKVEIKKAESMDTQDVVAPTTGQNVVVVGIGAMGGGMACALLAASITRCVTGYDKSVDAVKTFFGESQAAKKAPSSIPSTMASAITESTDFVVLSLVNQGQCEQVCFGEGDNLLNLVPKGSCVVMTSTVTATWATSANERFKSAGILFVDCPVSGGPARALTGELTIMASGNAESLTKARPVLDALGKEVHIIEGGAGFGSTVKCVHQLLAGVHICAAAEAMAMAAKAGLDVEQLYRIVNGAAGASWMFTDRGQRMLSAEADVKSALDIFVKDLDIVYSEAKAIKCPIPLASVALQQFISGQCLGLGKSDDSQVVKVYERITSVSVLTKNKNH